ncbi:GNAT family N-acetyltransferase [Hamadaea tsunoensis]|uniref:GNAT family N-acetyltransferase n=1 Tax=Hamadaea tsunoensis TaxID=53368 RepID=UPI00040976E3|nr:GNAT family N-acetyltransferase [Hamadaea tsunoensis]
MEIRLEHWSDDDSALLLRTNAPAMTEHLGGPESPAKLADRHAKYLAMTDPAEGLFFRIVGTGPDGAEVSVGSIGYWSRDWQGERVYESGWKVLPEYQGHGIATAAARLIIGRARDQHRHATLHAYPSLDNPASNAICRKAGFTLAGPCDFEFPPGNPLRCNDWYADLT